MTESMTKFQRAVGRNLVYMTRWIVGRLPYPVYRVLANFFLLFSKLVMYRKRHIAWQNLKCAFGRTKSDAELKVIARRYFQNFGKGLVDLIYYADHQHLTDENVRIEGKEHLDKALAQGKGVILTGGHFGNFILMYHKLARMGYKTNVIMRRMRDEALEQYITEMRQEIGVRTVYDLPPKKCVVESLKVLRRNEILVILLDQNYGSAGRVLVDFFGRQAATASGPVVFSLRTKAPILPIFCLGDAGDMRHKIVIEPELELETGKDEQDTIERNVARITKIIESYVVRYPHEWGGWIHKRWKSKPAAEQEIIDRLKESPR